ncbi:hypothetical protein MPER_04054 [Moniliophthora perniciosa FA553]|nr:hypothetical protein MPER_04054 [Moniliophthora perniciosa FA553]
MISGTAERNSLGRLRFSALAVEQPVNPRSLIANIISMAAHNATPRQGLRAGDIALGVLPFYHAAGLVVNLSIVVVEKYDFSLMLNTIARFQITTLMFVPVVGAFFVYLNV